MYVLNIVQEMAQTVRQNVQNKSWSRDDLWLKHVSFPPNNHIISRSELNHESHDCFVSNLMTRR